MRGKLVTTTRNDLLDADDASSFEIHNFPSFATLTSTSFFFVMTTRWLRINFGFNFLSEFVREFLLYFNFDDAQRFFPINFFINERRRKIFRKNFDERNIFSEVNLRKRFEIVFRLNSRVMKFHSVIES